MAEKINRVKKDEQEPQVRNKNFKEVTYGYTEAQAQLEASRCIQCKNPKCVPGCPMFIDIPGFIQAIKDKDYKKSYDILKKDNDFPAICGRVCPQEDQCEGACILGIKGEPVAIGNLERFVADYVRENKLDTKEAVPVEQKNIKTAIVGSGPSGLACAGELNKIGYDVTVFEALHELGGVLSYGIPEFRLPNDIIKYEIDALKDGGVKFVNNFVVGKTETVDELMQENGFSAVYIASGAGFPSFMKIPGEDLNAVYSSNEFLTRMNLMRAYQFPQVDTPIKIGKRVAVIGGGNTAMDAARGAMRLGAEKVYIIYRRSEQEMPARIEEVHHAKEEGIDFRLLCSPVEYIGDEEGFVKKAVIEKMELGEPDASGRRRPVPTGEKEELDVDVVIVAIGTQANPIIQDTTEGLETNKWGYIVADDNGKTTKPGVYAGGDIVSGAATVIKAMGAGKVAAKAIDEYLSGISQEKVACNSEAAV
ncbi:MAG: NADPH-dependent glutamate synthase [Candidatus Margulisiibacteriota bacterium]